MNKQIEDMANDYYEAMLKARGTLGSMNEGAPKWYAKELYAKGWRKESDVAREQTMTCKDCRFFIKGEGRGGTCEKKPFATAKNGKPHIINGKMVNRYVSWGTPACKTFFERSKTNE